MEKFCKRLKIQKTRIEDLEGRFGQCHGSITRRKISPPEVRVSYFDLLR